MFIHVVKPNETVYSIARLYQVSPENIIFDNQLYTPSDLAVGQALLILIPKIIHIVRANDTFSSIATQYQMTPKQLIRNNPYLLLSETIQEGQTLVIEYEGEKIRSIEVNGFAYPFINRTILKETLPYLSRLSIFSYGFYPNGDLIVPDDSYLLEAAKQFQVSPILVLTTITEQGSFDNSLIHIMVNDMQVQNRLIQNILGVLQEKNYIGVDCDFEYILPEDRDKYTNFIQNLTNVLRPEGFHVSVDLAPKESRNQRGLLYEGIDYGAIGQIADDVMLMTYEWGYTYSDPMAVAPINKVHQILDYAVTEIPRYKINMGIPNYAYEWPLPTIRSVTRARTIGNIEAVELAIAHHAVIEFDPIAMTPHFQFTSNGNSYEVWFEDVRSIQAKLNLVPEYEIMGVGYWNIMRYFRPNWLLVNHMFEIQ